MANPVTALADMAHHIIKGISDSTSHEQRHIWKEVASTWVNAVGQWRHTLISGLASAVGREHLRLSSMALWPTLHTRRLLKCRCSLRFSYAELTKCKTARRSAPMILASMPACRPDQLAVAVCGEARSAPACSCQTGSLKPKLSLTRILQRKTS